MVAIPPRASTRASWREESIRARPRSRASNRSRQRALGAPAGPVKIKLHAPPASGGKPAWNRIGQGAGFQRARPSSWLRQNSQEPSHRISDLALLYQATSRHAEAEPRETLGPEHPAFARRLRSPPGAAMSDRTGATASRMFIKYSYAMLRFFEHYLRFFAQICTMAYLCSSVLKNYFEFM